MNKYLMSCTCLLFASSASAITIIPDMDKAFWQASKEGRACVLSQDLHGFGLVKFSAHKNSELNFSVETGRLSLFYGQVSVRDIEPPWTNKSLDSHWLKTTTANKLGVAKFDPSTSQNLLNKLENGNWAQLKFSGKDRESVMSIPGIRRMDAVSAFIECQQNIPVLEFEEINGKNLYFRTGRKEPSQDVQEWLSLVADYVIKSPDTKKVLIDGHSDKSGDEFKNLKLSKERANSVALHLLENGVNRELIEVRAHGTRYPASDLPQKNRRVTLRIIRTLPNKNNEYQEDTVSRTSG